jgi:DNA-binding CsgD family transcriptional regulator
MSIRIRRPSSTHPVGQTPDMDARSRPDRPITVLEGPVGCSRDLVDELRSGGFVIAEGLHAPTRPARTVCVGVVDDHASAGQALLAVLGGAGLVVEARADRATVDRLVDDLRRLGPVDHRVVESVAASGPEVSIEARAIIGLLAMGLSLGEAARVLGLARRTADRRLAEARRGLGVTRTTEAVARARRLGWLDRDMADSPIPGSRQRD